MPVAYKIQRLSHFRLFSLFEQPGLFVLLIYSTPRIPIQILLIEMSECSTMAVSKSFFFISYWLIIYYYHCFHKIHRFYKYFIWNFHFDFLRFRFFRSIYSVPKQIHRLWIIYYKDIKSAVNMCACGNVVLVMVFLLYPSEIRKLKSVYFRHFSLRFIGLLYVCVLLLLSMRKKTRWFDSSERW